MDVAVVVYGFYGSFCTQKVYLALAEKGVEATRRLVDIGPRMENYEPWYARLNPAMVVPTLQHDDTLVCDSARIIRYIDKTFEGPPLLPRDPDARARVEAIVDRIDGLKIRELSYGGMRGLLSFARDRVIQPRRLKVLRRNRARAPDLADVYDARISDIERWNRTMQTPAALQTLRDELRATLEDLDAKLRGEPFVVGDSYTLADVMATVLCARLRLLGLVDLADYPELEAHYQRMRARPRFPSTDIVESVDRGKMVRLLAPFFLPRVAAVLVGVALLSAGIAMALG